MTPLSPHDGAKKTKSERTMDILKDGKWHSGRELALKVSHRFGSTLHILKTSGVAKWEKRLDPARPEGEVWYEYRLVAYHDDFWDTHVTLDPTTP